MSIKRFVLVLIGVMAAVQSYAALKPSVDFSIGGLYYTPQDDDSYDYGYGAEIQPRFWLIDQVGFALSVGYADWQINEMSESASEDGITVSASIDGDVRLVPMGGSLLIRPIKTDKLSVILEGGVRYVVVDSSAECKVEAHNEEGESYSMKETIDMDDGVVGVVAATIEGKISKNVSLFIGGGYQYDISKGEVKILDEDAGKNELEAFFVKAGLSFAL